MDYLHEINAQGTTFRLQAVVIDGECVTPAGTAIKEFSFGAKYFMFVPGITVSVKFTYANTYGDGKTTYPKANLSSLYKNIPICNSRGSYAASGAWEDGDTLLLQFTGDKLLILNSSLSEINEDDSSPINSKALRNYSNSWITGKTINIIGDSLTYGYDIGAKYSRMERPYPGEIAKKLKCTVNNYGIGGSTLSTVNEAYGDTHPMWQRVSTYAPADINIVFGGGNDMLKYGFLGSIDSTDTNTICGALNTIAQYYATNQPGSIVIFIGVPRAHGYASSYYQSEASMFYSTQQINESIKHIAHKYGYVFFDIFNELPCYNPSIPELQAQWNTSSTGKLDNIHWNQAFVDAILVPYLCGKLINLSTSNTKGRGFDSAIFKQNSYAAYLTITLGSANCDIQTCLLNVNGYLYEPSSYIITVDRRAMKNKPDYLANTVKCIKLFGAEVDSLNDNLKFSNGKIVIKSEQSGWFELFPITDISDWGYEFTLDEPETECTCNIIKYADASEVTPISVMDVNSPNPVNSTALFKALVAAITTEYSPTSLKAMNGYAVAQALSSVEQIQSDWNQTDNTKKDFILNKPTIPAAQVNSDWNATSGKAQILNKPTIPDAQVQSDWEETDTKSKAYIKNKPSIPVVDYPVTSVNGKTGKAVLYGSDIAMSSSDTTKLNSAIGAKNTKLTYNDYTSNDITDTSTVATITGSSNPSNFYVRKFSQVWSYIKSKFSPGYDYYSTSSTYAVGDIVTYSGALYACTTAITKAEAWTSSHWSTLGALKQWISDGIVHYIAGTYSTTTYPAYDATKTYAVGALVMYNNYIYVCSTAITTAEAWNSSHWTTSGATAAYTGTDRTITSLKAGLKIAFKLPLSGSGSVTININGLGAKTVRRNNGNLTTHLPKDTVVVLTYDGTYWCWADYDSNTNTNVTQNKSTSDAYYPVIAKHNANTTNETSTVNYGADVLLNPSTGDFKAKSFTEDGLALTDKYVQIGRAGHTISGTWQGAGYLTVSKTNARFSIPLTIMGDITIISAGIKVRQNGNYIAGSSTARLDVTSAITVSREFGYCVFYVTIAAASAAINNDVVGIEFGYTIKVS